MHDAMAMYYYASKLFSVQNFCSSRPTSPCEDYCETFASSSNSQRASRHQQQQPAGTSQPLPTQQQQQNRRKTGAQQTQASTSSKKGSSGMVNGGATSGPLASCSSDSTVARGSTASPALDTTELTHDSSEPLVYKDGHLVSGSLEALLQRMVPTADYFPERAYLFAFLLSARLFMKPHELLGEVCALCDAAPQLQDGGAHVQDPEAVKSLVPNAVRLLAEWSTTFPYDFRDERVMAHVRSLTEHCVSADPSQRLEVSLLLQTLLERLTELEKFEEYLQRISVDSTTRNTEAVSTADVTELCPNAERLAQQLTHVELERLSYIGPEEFVQAFAKERPHLEPTFRDVKRTRNLENYVQWFNRLSYFVATEVCKHSKRKFRVRAIQYWIEVARECFNICNFNSLMAILAGLNMTPVARLKKTWSKVSSVQLEVLQRQMDPACNFSSYRSSLKAAIWRAAGANAERERIVIPFFSLLLKDLFFLNEGCCSKLPNGHINFTKFWELARRVTEFLTWKQISCPFEKDHRSLAFLQASPVLTENALELLSYECEQPDNNHEKERFKNLKAESTLS